MRAVLDALGPEGTLMAYDSWQEHVYHASDWPAEHRDAYTADPPAFDTATVTTAQLAQRLKALIDDLISHGLIGAS